MVQENCLKKPLIFIVGCTASGKSALGLSVAQALGADIISCDSMQVYRGMDIGTAKPSKSERQLVKHHMIDIVDIDGNFSVSKYVNMAEIVVAAQRVPLLVGGTGLYVNGLIYGYNFAQAASSAAVRGELKRQLEEFGGEYLYQKLQAVDPIAAKEIHCNNVVRVMRALEIYYATGQPKSKIIAAQPARKYLAFDIALERNVLYERINARVDDMLQNGLIDEVDNILRIGYNPELTALKAIGYSETIDYLNGKTTREKAVDLIKQHTRNYAKRQITWFKRLPNVVHLSGRLSEMTETVLKVCSEALLC